MKILSIRNHMQNTFIRPSFRAYVSRAEFVALIQIHHKECFHIYVHCTPITLQMTEHMKNELMIMKSKFEIVFIDLSKHIELIKESKFICVDYYRYIYDILC